MENDQEVEGPPRMPGADLVLGSQASNFPLFLKKNNVVFSNIKPLPSAN